MSSKKMKQYFYLMRLNKPIGIFLLLWPTLWALWLAGDGRPSLMVTCIFTLGVILMRSAGCIINDIADRHVDKYVERTRNRPLATGRITVANAFVLFMVLIFAAFLLVLLLNRLTLWFAFAGAALTVIYPFLKRVTHLPQLGLGVAFAWGVPMAFTALTDTVPAQAWIVFAAAAIWPVIYDTMYAMVDRDDDVKVGVKSTAILFGNANKWILGVLQIIFLSLMIWCGFSYQLKLYYYIGLIMVMMCFIYQQWLIKNDDREKCFHAFLNNQWVGMIIFLGIVLSYEL